MSIALYLLKSTLAMGILLLFYRHFLEKEKMHRFNRMFLLGAVILSLLAPLLPTGIISFGEAAQPTATAESNAEVEINQTLMESAAKPLVTASTLFLSTYVLVFSFFLLKFGRNILILLNKVRGKRTKLYKNAKIVLLDEKISPYSFMNYIFIQKEEYLHQKIDQQLLDHELTHVKQRHSWDILFIELVILIFWFNPILRWYKTAIQLNHEFLADESVIDKYKTVKTYQHLLLDTIANTNKIYLASNINFHLTQKRLMMMTKTSSSRRKNVLIFSVIPIVLGLFLCIGNPAFSQASGQEITRELEFKLKEERDRYFADAIVHYKTEDGKTKVISYKSLDGDIKGKLPPPPPPPPVPPGTEQSIKKTDPLPKGTIVYLSEDGSVQIGSKHNGVATAPPPPPPPPPAYASNDVVHVKPPKPPKPPKAPKPSKNIKAPKAPVPPPPPPPKPVEEVFEEASKFYIDGKEVSYKKARETWEKNQDKVKTINVKKGDDGKTVMYINMM
ncbi:MAG: M56 family metallopeptidase [Bacteroidota bacterium]